MGNTCNKASEVPSYEITIPQTNQIPPLQIQNQAPPPLNSRFKIISQRSDFIKSRVKYLSKAKGFSHCEIATKERSLVTKFNTELIKQAQSSQVLTIKISPSTSENVWGFAKSLNGKSTIP